MADTIPIDELLFGTDMYSGQGYPDVARLADEGYAFFFEKATGEDNYVNPYRNGNRRAVRALNNIAGHRRMFWGDYDWVEPHRAAVLPGTEAAIDYWRVLNADAPVLDLDFVLVDYESPIWYEGILGRQIEPFMKPYLHTLSDLARRKIGIYTARYFLDETGATNWSWLADESRFFLWQAAPGPNETMPDTSFWPVTPPPFARTVIHQHDWHGTSPAVQMEFDRNRFRGAFTDLAGYARVFGSQGGGEVKEPIAGKVSWYVNDQGEPIFVWNMGGKTKSIRNVNIVNLGMEVDSATEDDVIVGASIFDGVQQPYYERPDNDESATAIAVQGSGGDKPKRVVPLAVEGDPDATGHSEG